MRIPPTRIEELKMLLKKHYNLDYDDEQAQQAGRAILKFVGLKLYQQINKEVNDERSKATKKSKS